MTTYKPSQILRALTAAVRLMRPIFLTGSPGVGKSHLVAQVARSLSISLIDVRATLLDPVDLRGLPRVQDGITHWAPPIFLPREGSGILFLDELNAAPTSVQTACYQLVLDRKLGEYELPKGWCVIAAGNKLSDGATAMRMPSALANRFVHLEMSPDLDDWCSWALSAGVTPMLIAFLRYRPELLHQHSKTELAYPTPRSWEFVSQILSAGCDRDTELGLIEGAVGQGAAIECAAFTELYRNLPNIDAILLNPDKADVPKDPAARYAVTFAIASRATDQNFSAVVRYLDRLPEEYSVLGMKHATQRDNKLAQTTTFTTWAVKHSSVLS